MDKSIKIVNKSHEELIDEIETLKQKLEEIKHITIEQLEYCQNEFDEWWINSRYKHGYDEWSVAIHCLTAIKDRL